MTLAFRAAAAVVLALSSASPCLALSVNRTPLGSEGAAKLADPDEALSGLYKQFAGASDPRVRPKAEARGPLTRYDLSAAHGHNAPDGYALVRAHPADPAFNPFMADRSEDPSPDAASR